MNFKLRLLFGFFITLLGFSHLANAQLYFLKFETSGATLTASNLASDTGSWVNVSIVTSVGSDGQVHWPGGTTGSDISYKYYRYYNSSNITNHGYSNSSSDKKVFYVADVPRSISIVTSDGVGTQIISVGDTPVPFNAAPSFLLPDGFVVSAGLSSYYHYNPSSSNPGPFSHKKIYIAADSSVKVLNVSGVACPKGWVFKGSKIQHSVPFAINGTCGEWITYSGSLTHVIKFE